MRKLLYGLGASIAANVGPGVASKASSYFQKKAIKTGKKVLGISRPSRNYGAVSTGSYQGKFKKPKRLAAKDPMTVAAKYGYSCKSEKYGLKDDSDCLYFIHGTWALPDIARSIIGCLVRKLFQKAGIYVTSLDQELPIRSYDVSGPYTYTVNVDFVSKSTGVHTVSSYSIPDDASLKTVVDAQIALRDSLYSLATDNSDILPHFIRLKIADAADPGAVYRTVAMIPIHDTVFNVHVKSSLAVQNRTLPALAGGGDADRFDTERLDNQPLKGWHYSFKHASPRINHTTNTTGVTNVANTPLQVVGIDGTNIVGSIGLGPLYKEPPLPKHFQNINKASKIALEPGSIKTSVVSHVYKGRLPTLMKSMQSWDSTTLSFFYSPGGRSACLSFEERIQTVSSNKITLQYEREVAVGCTMSIKKPTAMLSDYNSSADP